MILQVQKNQEVEGQEDPKKGVLETWHLSLRLLVSKSWQSCFFLTKEMLSSSVCLHGGLL